MLLNIAENAKIAATGALMFDTHDRWVHVYFHHPFRIRTFKATATSGINVRDT